MKMILTLGLVLLLNTKSYAAADISGAVKISNSVVIELPIDTVFNYLTFASNWPKWHPATRAVSGVTDRPMNIGDVVHEVYHTPWGENEIDWYVIEKNEPYQMVLRGENESAIFQITYNLGAGLDQTVYRRQFEYKFKYAFLKVIQKLGSTLKNKIVAQAEIAVNNIKKDLEKDL